MNLRKQNHTLRLGEDILLQRHERGEEESENQVVAYVRDRVTQNSRVVIVAG